MAVKALFGSSAASYDGPRIFLPSVVQTAIDVGECMMLFFNDPSKIVSHIKADGSPVTNVDEACSHLIVERLSALTPGIPVLTEENVTRLPDSILLGKGQVWVVDPLDGTSEFQNHQTGFAINISLFEEGQPVLGAVYQPALGIGFCAATDGLGAYQFDTLGAEIRSFHLLHTTPHKPGTPLRTVFRQTANNLSAYQSLRGRLEQAHINLPTDPDTSVGLIREIRVAMNLADVCVKLGSKPGPGGGGYPWDVGAMIPIVRAAGGCIRTWTGDQLEISALNERVPSLIVFGDPRIAEQAYPALHTIAGPVSEKSLANPAARAVESPPMPSYTAAPH